MRVCGGDGEKRVYWRERVCWREREAIVEPGDGGRWDTVIVTGEGEGHGTKGDEVGGGDSGGDIRGICVCVCVCVCVSAYSNMAELEHDCVNNFHVLRVLNATQHNNTNSHYHLTP